MEVLAWVLSLIFATTIGFFARDIRDKIQEIQQKIVEKVDKPKIEERKSMLLDPDDPVQKTLEEHAELMRRINPGTKL